MELQDAVAEAALVVVPPAEAIALVPGFRFHPTDEELVRYYLTRKVCGKPIRFEAVSETDVYSCEPWKLACYSSLKSRDLEWYFFSAIDKKYGNGSRMNRATGQGYWKATGKDRVVRHKSRTIGMKKTLVFHSGRAPDGKRTNWVMHEYRLIDDELEQAGVVQDAFMLCRIFQKSGYGPPNADRYAPFVEEEWNDDTTLFVPGEDAEDDKANRDDCNEHDLDSDKTLLLIDQYPFESQSDEYLYKRDISDDVEHLSKKPEVPYSRANCSEDSTTTSQDPAAITTTNTKNPPKLFGFSLVQSVVEHKESKPSNPPPPLCDTSNHVEKSVPHEYSTFVSGLENEIVNVSMERERLKIEVMRAQSMMNMLYSRIEVLAQENEELRIHLRGR